MKCPKCAHTGIVIKRDSRGIPSAYCDKCGSYIKKMSTGEVLDFYENLLLLYETESKEEQAEEPASKQQKPPCKYCTERYFFRRGGPRSTRTEDIPIEHKFCPMCGREIQESDWRY